MLEQPVLSSTIHWLAFSGQLDGLGVFIEKNRTLSDSFGQSKCHVYSFRSTKPRFEQSCICRVLLPTYLKPEVYDPYRQFTYMENNEVPTTKSSKLPRNVAPRRNGALIDWYCFYYFVRNSLVALLEAPCARIFSWDSWISVFPDIFF